MKGVCSLQMCCEISPWEVEETLEAEEHMMQPDAEESPASSVAVTEKRVLQVKVMRMDEFTRKSINLYKTLQRLRDEREARRYGVI